MRQRELERQAKEMVKLSALEQARLEVETYENSLEVLLSIHKEQSNPWDWMALATSLPPVPPHMRSHNELKASQRLAASTYQNRGTDDIQKAQQQDEREFQDAMQAYAVEHDEWAKFTNLANRILAGEHGAYIEAIQELSPFTELAGIGSSLHFTVHDARTVECILSTNSRKAIPSEVKSLTAAGKVTVKQMPRPRFVEIYQDYVCGCVLRVARELFALLPVDTLIITASVESLDTSTGLMAERPFLSAAISRETLKALNFDNLDPSDSIMGITHRGELKASRKTGDFEFISPLTVSDIGQVRSESTGFSILLAAAKRLNAELAQKIAALDTQSENALSTKGEM